MIDKEFIYKKLVFIEEYFKELEEVCNISMDEMKKDFMRFYAMERIFQLIVDEMIDINNHIIIHSGFKNPNDLQSTFITLGENDVIPMDFANKIFSCVGLRNRLVHRYEKIDKDLELRTIYSEKDDFKEYVRLISDFLKKSAI